MEYFSKRGWCINTLSDCALIGREREALCSMDYFQRACCRYCRGSWRTLQVKAMYYSFNGLVTLFTRGNKLGVSLRQTQVFKLWKSPESCIRTHHWFRNGQTLPRQTCSNYFVTCHNGNFVTVLSSWIDCKAPHVRLDNHTNIIQSKLGKCFSRLVAFFRLRNV